MNIFKHLTAFAGSAALFLTGGLLGVWALHPVETYLGLRTEQSDTFIVVFFALIFPALFVFALSRKWREHTLWASGVLAIVFLWLASFLWS